MTSPTNLALRHMLEIDVEVGPLTSIGTTPLGDVRLIQLLNGTFNGPDLNGTLLPGGTDWQQVRNDGTLEIRARYLLQTDQYEMLQVQSEGIRAASAETLARLARGESVDPTEYYFRTALRFTTAAPRLLRLNNVLGISRGRREKDRVILSFFEVL